VTKDNIPKSKIPKAIDALRALNAKELDDIPAREAIRKMRRQIERVLRLGYSYEEVSKTLAPLDINISPERIRYLLNDIKRSTRKKPSSTPSLEDSNTPVIDEPLQSENSDRIQSNTQSAKKPESKSQAKSKSASSNSTNTKTTKTAQQISDSNGSEYQNSSRPAFIPQLISDEDL
jgi:hypothetical protein